MPLSKKHNYSYQKFTFSFIIFLHFILTGTTWSGSETPPLEKDIEIYKKLLEKIKGIKFIKHKKYLEEKIEYLKEKIRKIEKKEYLDKYN